MIKRAGWSLLPLYLAVTCWNTGAAETVSDNESSSFRLSGESRVRYEALDGQFRAGGSGGDQLLLLRTLIKGEWDVGPLTLVGELQDSRTYLADEGTPLGSSIANPLDILQAHLQFNAPGLLGVESESILKVGRQTVSIGSKRQIERVSYANVIKSFTGLHLISENADKDELHFLTVVPTRRFPNSRPDLDDNVLSGDEEEWNRVIWGSHYRNRNAFSGLVDGVWGEVFVYGLNEWDEPDRPSVNRDYITSGFRLHRPKETGQWDIDLEAAWRTGSRRLTNAAEDTTDLDVNAGMLFGALGFTFDVKWTPRIALEYYWASGDDSPDDTNFDQYERLFGSRRTDLNNTSIHGPLTPANLRAPGLRIEVTPSDRTSARLAWSAASLDSPTDAWVIARQRDLTGQSGDFIGHALDGRFVYEIVPDQIDVEIGASWFSKGEFGTSAPGATSDRNTSFVYFQMRVQK